MKISFMRLIISIYHENRWYFWIPVTRMMKETKYDYLIVGVGLLGSTFAYRAKRMGKKCLVMDKRPHLGGK